MTVSALRSSTSTWHAALTRPSPRRWMHTSRLSRLRVRGGTMALRACPGRQANCTLIARTGLCETVDRMAPSMLRAVTCGFPVERGTGIEPALSAWESDRSGPLTALNCTANVPQVTARDRMNPGLMARQWPVARPPGYWPEAGRPRSLRWLAFDVGQQIPHAFGRGRGHGLVATSIGGLEAVLAGR